MNLLNRDFIVREPLLVGILVLITIVFRPSRIPIPRHTIVAVRARRGVVQSRRPGIEEQSSAAAAVEDFRTALFYDPRNRDYRHAPGGCLTAGRIRPNQALNYYLASGRAIPGMVPSICNWLASRPARATMSAAERYFNGAIFGDWPEKPLRSPRRLIRTH